MKRKVIDYVKLIMICLFSLMIPGLLILNSIQSARYRALMQSVLKLEEEQEKLVEQNRKLITEISVLSSTDRIENIAENELNMRRAESEEIVRVEMKGRKK